MVYHITVVRLNPLQLVLVGTILEGTVFLCEIPTGALADVKSRRLSIIIGYFLIGLGFVVEGSLPYFAAVAFAQVLWGLGYTFTSGATQAWIADEIGSERAQHFCAARNRPR
jgi:DHA3 family tetracycline resistance protein-like MFS transporter